MSHNLLTVNELKVYFPIKAGIFRKVVSHVPALNGVDIHLNKDEILGVVGETGSGKSTLARAILRLIEPTSGSVVFEGKNILQLHKKEMIEFRKQSQIVFQDPFSSLNQRKTVLESIGEGLLYHGFVKTKSMQKERVAEILSCVGLSPDIMNRYPHQFSGGQQQRICIGRAIAFNPKMIIFDEALSALDVSIQAQILNLLLELKRKLSLSYLFISHDLSVVKYLCDRTAVLYLGKVIEIGKTSEIFNDPNHPYTQSLISAFEKMQSPLRIT